MKNRNKEVKENKGIQSIEVGFKIIDSLVSFPIPVSLTKLSEYSGLSPSKLHTYLVSFKKIGFIQQDPNTGFYSIGSKALQFGLAYLDQNNLYSITKPIVEYLVDEIGETIFLGVWGNKGPTIINRIDGINSHAIFDLRIGSVLPLLSSALGLNFTAFMPFSLIEGKIKKELKSNKNLPFKTIEEVQKKRDEIKKNKVVNCAGLLLTDFTAISSPIFDFSGNITAALTIMGRIGELNDSLDSLETKLLKEATYKISKSLGYQPTDLNGLKPIPID